MWRFPNNSLFILGSVFKNKSHTIFQNKCCRALIKIPYDYVQTASYCSTKELKSKSPLSNLIAKDVKVDKNEEQIDEEEATKQREAAWRTMKLTLAIFGVTFTFLGGYLVVTLGAPERDANGQIIKDELSEMPLIKQYLIRTYRELDYYRRLIREPSRDKLLPDPLGYPYLQPKYTLILELTDVLVHPDWTYNTGWRFKKRPGLDYFLETLHGHFEIVIYTAEQGMTVFPLIDAIDPKNIISYKLVRDATHFTDGHHVKSLNKLNRDLSKVICIDWNASNVKFNPENLFNIRRWDGNDDDTTLMDLANFLKTIADNDIEDVRDVLKYYKNFDDPIMAFRQKQKQFIETLEAQEAARRSQEPSKVSKWTPSFLNRRQF